MTSNNSQHICTPRTSATSSRLPTLLWVATALVLGFLAFSYLAPLVLG